MADPAINTRTANKAQIKRASAAARRSMNVLDRKALADLQRIYRDAVKDIQLRIAMAGGSSGTLRLENMRTLLDQVEGRLGQLTEARNALLNTNLEAAALLGVKPLEGLGASVSSVSLNQVAHSAVQFVQSFAEHNGVTLSARLWRLDNSAREMVTRHIESAVIQGHSASQAAQEFLGRGAAVPAGIQTGINNANAVKVSRVFGHELMKGEMNPYAQARRLFRTEINRAHGEAYMAGAESHPDFGGFRYLLSPGHPRPDICDMHSSVNLFGLGAGVYPSRERCPWPAHPNILSYVEVVFSDEITQADREGKEDRISWLKQQPPHIQEGVLGARKKRAALDAGILKQNEIGTPWKVLKKRYARRGIDVERLRPLTVEDAVQIDPNPLSGQPLRPGNRPVSAALNVEAHKRTAKHVLGVIDKLHDDGRLPLIPLKNTNSAKALGQYWFTRGGDALSIKVKSGGSHKELTLAHEIGHFLDHKGLPDEGFTSISHKMMEPWRQAVKNSKAYKHLRELGMGPASIETPLGPREVNKRYVMYLLQIDEAWARSYAQWVAVSSGDSVMMKQLEEMVSAQRKAPIGYASQWEADDFEPIAAAIDDVMRSMGWM